MQQRVENVLLKNASVLSVKTFPLAIPPKDAIVKSLSITYICLGIGNHLEMSKRIQEGVHWVQV